MSVKIPFAQKERKKICLLTLLVVPGEWVFKLGHMDSLVHILV